MKKPIIGVLPLFDRERDSYWMLPGYFKGLEAAGALPLMLPLDGTEDAACLVRLCDGLLFTGGQDVDPAVYGQKPAPTCGTLCPERDRLELALLQKAILLDRPVLGICRGAQLINAALGGSLWQDLPTERPTGLHHRMERPYNRKAHNILLNADSPLAALYGTEVLAVNSCHHQGLHELAPTLRAMAVAEDGLIEAVWRPESSFLWAVQWHPEFYDPVSGPGAPIFHAFVQAAAGNQKE